MALASLERKVRQILIKDRLTMNEQEYCDLSDLQLLRSAKLILSMANAFEEPNTSRLANIRANLCLMTDELEPKVSKYMDADA
jgi:hypothetical protein